MFLFRKLLIVSVLNENEQRFENKEIHPNAFISGHKLKN